MNQPTMETAIDGDIGYGCMLEEQRTHLAENPRILCSMKFGESVKRCKTLRFLYAVNVNMFTLLEMRNNYGVVPSLCNGQI